MDELPIGEAIDQAEAIVGRMEREHRVFARVRDVLRAAVDAETARQQADARLTALGAEEHAIRNRLQSLSLQLPLLEADVDEARRHTTTTLDALTRQMTEATQAAQEVIRTADASAAAKLAQLEADYAAREEALIGEVDALLMQKTKLADAIDAMQAQVAALTKG